MFSRASFTLICAVIFVLASPISTGTEPSKKFRFSIPSSSLIDTLISIGKISHTTVVFDHASIRKNQSPKIDGMLTTEEAIKIAIQQCECKIAKSGANAYIVKVKRKPKQQEKHSEIISNDLEEVLVRGTPQTGSHLFRKSTYSNSSLITLNKYAIETTSSTSLHDLLKTNPVVTGATTSTAISNGGNGTSTVTLRGLPADTTLVLVNGMRVAPFPVKSQLVDLYSIPFFAVDSVEIFKDGTSAIYGSDAIAGTVNVQLKKELDGVQVEQYHGDTTQGGLETSSTTLEYGLTGNNHSLYFSGFTFNQTAIWSSDRDISQSADARSRGGVDGRSTATPDGIITLPSGERVRPVSSPSGEVSYRPVTQDDLYNFYQDTTSHSPSERNGFYTYNTVEIHKSLSVDTSFYYAHAESEIHYAAVPINTRNSHLPLNIASDNIYNNFNIDITDVSRRLTELSNRKQELSADSLFGSVTLTQTNENSILHASFHGSQSNYRTHSTNLVDGHKLQLGLRGPSECNTTCIPINLLDGSGTLSSEQVEHLKTSSTQKGRGDLYSLNLDYGIDFNSKTDIPVLAAVGAEYREERTKSYSLQHNSNSFIIGNIKNSNIDGERSIQELYGELEYAPDIIPVKGSETALELAFRYSHYDDFGTNTSPRLALRITPIPEFTFRASYSKSFHAPSLNELNNPGSTSNLKFFDPCSLEEYINYLPGCSELVINPEPQIIVETVGNLDLSPETAESTSAGILWKMGNRHQWFLGFDYYHIEQQNVIHPINPGFLIYQQAIGGDISTVQRNDSGALTKVTTSYLNTGKRELTSYDSQLGIDLRFGRFESIFRFNATYIDTYRVGSELDSYSENMSGRFLDVGSGGHGALPEWKFNTSLSLKYSNFQATYMNTYIDEMKEQNRSSREDRNLDSWLLHNIQLQYTTQKERYQVFLGVDNILDTPPPFSSTAYNDNFDARTHDLKGRYMYARLRLKIN